MNVFRQRAGRGVCSSSSGVLCPRWTWQGSSSSSWLLLIPPLCLRRKMFRWSQPWDVRTSSPYSESCSYSYLSRFRLIIRTRSAAQMKQFFFLFWINQLLNLPVFFFKKVGHLAQMSEAVRPCPLSASSTPSCCFFSLLIKLQKSSSLIWRGSFHFLTKLVLKSYGFCASQAATPEYVKISLFCIVHLIFHLSCSLSPHLPPLPPSLCRFKQKPTLTWRILASHSPQCKRAVCSLGIFGAYKHMYF